MLFCGPFMSSYLTSPSIATIEFFLMWLFRRKKFKNLKKKMVLVNFAKCSIVLMSKVKNRPPRVGGFLTF